MALDRIKTAFITKSIEAYHNGTWFKLTLGERIFFTISLTLILLIVVTVAQNWRAMIDLIQYSMDH